MIRLLRKKVVLIGFFIPMLTSVYAQDSQPINQNVLRFGLSQAIEVALSENPTIIVAGQEIEKRQYAKKGVISQLLPQISGSAGYTRTLKKQVMYMGGGGGFTELLTKPLIELTKPLYDELGMQMPPLGNDEETSSNTVMPVGLDNDWLGGFSLSLPIFAPTLYKSIQLSAVDIELAAEQARASKQDLVNQVSKAYFQLLLAQDSYEVLKQSYKQAEDNFEIVNNKYEQGLVSEYDKIRAEVQVRNLNPSLIQAKNAVTLTKLQLKVLMGIDSNIEVSVSGQLSDYETNLYAGYMQMDTFLLANNSSLLQMDLQAKMLQKNYEINKTEFLPNISLSAVYQWSAMNNDFKIKDYVWYPYGTVGVTISIPIFTGGSRNFKMKQTKIQMNQLEWNRIDLKRNLNMQAESYVNNMQQSVEQLASNKENVKQALKGRSIAQKRYEVGMGTILELNDSELALTQSKLTYTQSIYDFLVAKSDLDLVTGKEVISK